MTIFHTMEYTDYWLITLENAKVEGCKIEQYLEILLVNSKHKIYIRIEGNFFIEEDDIKYRYVFDADQSLKETIVALVSNQFANSMKVHKNGTLEIDFSDKVCLIVNSDPNYEAWGIVGPSNLRIVCMPGGELAFWQHA